MNQVPTRAVPGPEPIAAPVPIVAIATAPGRGAIGIVRVSGQGVDAIAAQVLGAAVAARLAPGRALHCRFLDAEGRLLDDGLALLSRAPRSYTGEDLLELQGHGGPVVLRLLLASVLAAGREFGVRPAEPGEFTRRAFLNDRLDLAQAEAVADLIDASSEAAARGASRSLAGEFSSALDELAQRFTGIRAHIEAGIDFPDEDVEELGLAEARRQLDAAASALDRVLERARLGAVLRDGLQVALVGAPNVGKSSLLNALAGRQVAIVSRQPGTTRDRIERSIDIGGLVLNIIDTAGLRATEDEVERIGIERTLQAVDEADLVLELIDASAPAVPAGGSAPPAWRQRLGRDAAGLTVVNKIDLSSHAPGLRDGALYVSALTGAGLDTLRAELLRHAGWARAPSEEGVFLARARHLHALELARGHLQAARQQLAGQVVALELCAEELRLAQRALGQITGQVTADDLLGEIFGRFCIGK
jgi:tRNA modification GTPase